uniref:FYVE-type domain-containing protein n=1 Tax=Caenorhabditis japonica TaxID=281687 RepID=A0A8R1DIU8_CAEJA
MDSSWDALNNSIKELSVEEQKAIRSVLEKDLEFQQTEQRRIRSLSTSVAIKKSSLEEKRRTSSVAPSESSESGLSSPGNISHGRTSPLPKWNNRVCSICQCTLGYILNSGTKCKKCSTALCEKCAHSVSTSGVANTPNSAVQKFHLCTICYSERELSAAKNEWVQGGDEMMQTSEKLLNAMKISDKRMSVQFPAAPPVNRGKTPYKRNLTLPAIQTNFLSIPDEEPGNIQSAGGNPQYSPKFWGGSPSPRSPRSFSSANSSVSNVSAVTPNDSLRALHPREPIGSPAPRPMSSTPLMGVPEDSIAPPSVERRRSAFEGSRRSGKLRRQSEATVPTFRLSMC